MDRATMRLVEEAADAHGGVIGRSALSRLGVHRDAVARTVDSGRWVRHGRLTIAVQRGPLSAEAERWRAVWEVGERVALLDGTSSLAAAGLTGYDEPLIHVSVTRNSRCSPARGVRIHRVTRRADEPGAGTVPRVPTPTAAIRAAGWAASDRQAALVLAMTVQQRLVAGSDLLRAARAVRIRGRRPFVRQVVQDVADGAQSLGELDFAVMCRRHGLPEPSRQVVCHGPRGRIYLDVGWDEADLAVEIDGSGHRTGLALSSDNLRQNDVTLDAVRVLRYDLLALRLFETQVMAQVRRGLGRV